MPGFLRFFVPFAGALAVATVATVSSAGATTFGEMEFTCPIGGEKFKTHVMMSTSIFGRRLDFKPLPLQSIAPIPKCPNGFVIFNEDLTAEELGKLTPIVASREYQALAKKDVSHFLAAYLMRKTGADSKAIAWTLLNAMWECEDAECSYRAAYLDDAAQAFGELEGTLKSGSSDWSTAAYLAAELQRQRGEFADASRRLDKLRKTKLTEEVKNLDQLKLFWKQCQSLVDAKNPDPTEFAGAG